MEIRFYDKDNKIIVNNETLIFSNRLYRIAKETYSRMLKKGVSNEE